MILIFSRSDDVSTFDVMRWIIHLSDATILRINSDETYDVELTLSEDNFCIRVDDYTFTLDDVSSVWLRKGTFWFSDLFSSQPNFDFATVNTRICERLMREDQALRSYFHYLLRKRSSVLGSAEGSTPNKLVVLDQARALGLRVPPFSVSNLASHAKQLLASRREYITKAISNGFYFFDASESKKGYISYTEALDEDLLDQAAERIPPSFFQDQIEKAFELRIFFLDDKLYATAIFSQEDRLTKIDYRKYNLDRPNRIVPFNLPDDIQDKLLSLTQGLALNTGSFDMIVDVHGHFYFLEVNPVGQFGAHSELCNLGIEQMIAERLLAHER